MNARMHPALLVIPALLAALLLSGCGNTGTSYYSSLKRTTVDAKDDLLGTRPTTSELFPKEGPSLIEINYDAADMIVGSFLPDVEKGWPIYYEPFTNRVDMGDPSPFGALVSEQVAARLAQRSFMITKGLPRKPAPPQAAPSQSGEAPKDLSAVASAPKNSDPDAPRPCLMSGTYLITGKVIFVSAQIATLDNGHVLGAHSWTVPVNNTTRAMLPQLGKSSVNGMTPSVRTKLSGNPHKIANPSGQPQNYVDRDLVR